MLNFFKWGDLFGETRVGNNESGKVHLVPAGALECTPDVIEQRRSIAEYLVSVELLEELGLQAEHMQSCNFLGRSWDQLNTGPQYSFEIRLKMSKESIEQAWFNNNHNDRGEHTGLIFIDASAQGIKTFLRNTYLPFKNGLKPDGVVETLQPCAEALAKYLNVSLEDAFNT